MVIGNEKLDVEIYYDRRVSWVKPSHNGRLVVMTDVCLLQ